MDLPERQELIIAHALLKQVKKCTSRKDLFDILSRLLAAVEKAGNYALLDRKDKKIKNQADRLAAGPAFGPDHASDRLIIEKAEGYTAPFFIREKTTSSSSARSLPRRGSSGASASPTGSRKRSMSAPGSTSWWRR